MVQQLIVIGLDAHGTVEALLSDVWELEPGVWQQVNTVRQLQLPLYRSEDLEEQILYIQAKNNLEKKQVIFVKITGLFPF